jgi:hypothetical protein
LFLFFNINPIQGKESVKKVKLKQTANLYDAKKKELTISSQSKQTSSEVKKTEIIPKPKKKEEIDDDEDESSSRFHYFDSGPHWCKSCDKFFQTMSLYFEHIHSNEHLSKHKESERTPWKTKDYAKDNETKVIRNKQQLVVAAKGVLWFQYFFNIKQELMKIINFYCYQRNSIHLSDARILL